MVGKEDLEDYNSNTLFYSAGTLTTANSDPVSYAELSDESDGPTR